jgi:hypothetical protein
MERYKYPKTPHLPWSPGVSRDDKVLKSTEHFNGKHIVVTLKMDGENTTMYPDHVHARSLDSKDHPSRHWIKGLHQNIRYLIPKGWRICGENLYAKHSIYYPNLPSYFLVFSVWNDQNHCLHYQDMLNFCSDLGLEVVLQMYQGIWNNRTPDILNSRFELLLPEEEGYVVSLYNGFAYADFDKSIAKYVRKDHVQTDDHWIYKPLTKNGLRG